jgi:hypothetical protein
VNESCTRFCGVRWLLRLALGLLLVAGYGDAPAQVNSWTKPASGKWEEPVWSAGFLPGTGQSILITNAGWKAVAIDGGTAASFPQTLTVGSIAVSAPVDSFNTLLLNHAGLGSPLTVNSLSIASNSALAMFGSALHLGGPQGVGMSIGGTVTHDAGSLVTGNQVDIGYIGAGVYNLIGGLLDVEHVWVIGPGVFNQTGGTNATAIVHLGSGAEYNLHDGDFESTVYFDQQGVFRQTGGRVNAEMTVWRGMYLLEGGVNNAGTTVPVSSPWDPGHGTAVQTGGTNFGFIHVGGHGPGSYTLSNGVVQTPALTVRHWGHFVQENGSRVLAGELRVWGDMVDRGDLALGHFRMHGGELSAPELLITLGEFTQEGGTITVGGELRMAGQIQTYALSGGLLTTHSTFVGAAWLGGFLQSGGIHVISNQLTVEPGLYFFRGYDLSGGELIVSNIVVHSGAIFNQTGGTVHQSGVLTLSNAVVRAGPGEQQFGRLQLLNAGTNIASTLRMPAGACTIRFLDSSGLPWSAAATLTIENWSGSPFGGGTQQLLFGNSPDALTTQQLTQVQFRDPAGYPAGLYEARILSNGEVVPHTLPPTGRVPPAIRLALQGSDAMQITVQGEPGANYGIEISSNLVDWTLWTNQTSANGVIVVTDTTAANAGLRFYRAVLLP